MLSVPQVPVPQVSVPRRPAVLGALVALLAATALAAPPGDAARADPVAAAVAGSPATADRVSGLTRYSTAAAVARLAHPAGAATALVATGEDPADALAAAVLAGAVAGPVLLAQRDGVPGETLEVLADLGVARVLVLGGPAALSDAVTSALVAGGHAVERVAGPDRYATAAEVARRAAALRPLPQVGGRRAALIVSGTDFPDALAAGAPAAALGMPALLAHRSGLPPATEQVLRDLGVRHAVVVGGSAVLPEPVTARLRFLGITVERVAGPTRTATAVDVAERFVEPGLLDGDTVLLARGDDFADALAAAPYGGSIGAPVLLTQDSRRLGRDTADHLEFRTRTGPPLAVVRAVGGVVALSDSALFAAVARTGPDGDGVPDVDLHEIREDLAPGQAAVLQVRHVPGTRPYDLAVFPCGLASVLGPGPDVFTDPARDASADGLGVSDTGSAGVTSVAGEPVHPTRIARDVPVAPEFPQVTARISSGGPDCAVVVLWLDVDGDGQLDVDGAAAPVEPYGVTVLRWVAGLVPDFDDPAVPQQALEGGPPGPLGLVAARVGRLAGFDRLVLEFAGSGAQPGWFVSYTDQPRQSGSGFPVEVAGATALVVQVRGVGASQLDPQVPPYRGPERLLGPGPSLREVLVDSPYEGWLDVFVGITERRGYRVFRLQDPTRVVVDVQHP